MDIPGNCRIRRTGNSYSQGRRNYLNNRREPVKKKDVKKTGGREREGKKENRKPCGGGGAGSRHDTDGGIR